MDTQASVLIVDDDADLCGWLAVELGRHGYEIETAHNCDSAVALLSRRPFNLALIDYRLPNKDGLVTLKELREVDPDLEAIVLTAYATVPNVVNSLRGGAYDFVSKPFTVRDLLPRLRAAIEKSELRGQVALHEASRALIGARSRAEVARRVVEVARKLLGCVAGVVSYEGQTHVEPGTLTQPESLALLEALLRSHPGHADALRLAPAELGLPADGVGAGLLLPLMHGTTELGRVVLVRPADLPAFTAADLRRAVVFSAQVALALENASLSERLEARLREANEARERLIQQEKLALTGQLAAGVAHELANPLTYVLTNLSAMDQISRRLTVECSGEAHAHAQLEELVNATKEALGGVMRMQTFVRDLRVFARPGQEPVAPVDIRDCVQFSISMLNNRMARRCRVEAALESVPFTLASKSRLEQVFVNLLANAMEAFPVDDPVRNVVRVTARHEGEHVVAVVTDNGPGVPQAIAPHVFEPFFTTKPAGAGSGLGLSICRQIVSSYGGVIELKESPPGAGATFEVRLAAGRGPAPT